MSDYTKITNEIAKKSLQSLEEMLTQPANQVKEAATLLFYQLVVMRLDSMIPTLIEADQKRLVPQIEKGTLRIILEAVDLGLKYCPEYNREEYTLNHVREIILDTLYPFQGWVYFIKDISATGYTKIGHTKHLDGRYHKIDIVVPFETKLIHSIYCKNRLTAERLVHDYFDEYHIKGEWFNLPETAINEVSQYGNEFDGNFSIDELFGIVDLE